MSHEESRQMEKGKAGQGDSLKRVSVLRWLKEKTENK